jgi:hypothetical protein
LSRKKRDIDRALSDIPPDRPGIPKKESIQSVETFVSPQGQTYKILHTTETDADEAPGEGPTTPESPKEPDTPG